MTKVKLTIDVTKELQGKDLRRFHGAFPNETVEKNSEGNDFTREEAIEWCKKNFCDFRHPVFPPPSGWAWAESGDAIVLIPIFTITTEGEAITSADLWS